MLVSFILIAIVTTLGASAIPVLNENEPLGGAIDGFLNDHLDNSRKSGHVFMGLPCLECSSGKINKQYAIGRTHAEFSNLILEFSIEDNNLMANGRQVFPSLSTTPAHAIQHLGNVESSGAMPIGFTMEVIPLASPSYVPETKLFNVRLAIHNLVTHARVDTVTVTLFQDLTNDLYIVKAEVGKAAPRFPFLFSLSYDDK